MKSPGHIFYDLYTRRLFDVHATICVSWEELAPKEQDAYEYAAQNFLEDERAA